MNGEMIMIRRRFLIGVGSLLTAAFVGEARAFARRTSAPLLLPPPRKAEETLYVYQQDWSDDGKWRVSLGPDEYEAPPAPTWREYLRGKGHSLETEADLKRVCEQKGLLVAELDKQLDGYGWEDEWDNFLSPQAKAHHLLKGLDLAPLIQGGLDFGLASVV
jgi:hypothetical protein